MTRVSSVERRRGSERREREGGRGEREGEGRGRGREGGRERERENKNKRRYRKKERAVYTFAMYNLYYTHTDLEYTSLVWGDEVLSMLCPAGGAEPHLALPELIQKVR